MKIKTQKFSFRQHRHLLQKYLIALNAKRRKHYETNMARFSGEEAILMLEEQIQMLKNLEYVGTWDGVAPNIQNNLFA
jgi:hypothetical protein